MKERLTVYPDSDLMARIDEISKRRGMPKSPIVVAAIASFVSPDAADRREAAFTRRLDLITRQMERQERDLGIAVEALALFVQFWLTVTPQLHDASQPGIRGKGAERYRDFIATLGRRVSKGRSLLREISEEIRPDRQGGFAEVDQQESGHVG